MKTKKFFFVLMVVSLIVAATVVLLTTGARPGVSRWDFDLLKPGMTESEADLVLRGPPRNDLRHTAIAWVPQAGGRPISAWIDPGSPARHSFVREEIPVGGRRGPKATPATDFFPDVASKAGRQGVWMTRTGLIAVQFGKDDKLQYKYFSEVNEHTPPSFLHWVASRPGMIRRSLGF